MPSVYLLLAGLTSGLVLARISSVDHPLFVIALSLPILLVIFQPKYRRPSFIFFMTMVWVGVAVSWKAQCPSSQAVAAWAPRDSVSLEGIVKDIPSVKTIGRKTKIYFVLNAERFLYARGTVRQGALPSADDLRIVKVSGAVQVFLINSASVPEPGDRIRIFGNLQRPHRRLNPGEMDYAAYLAANHVEVTFSGIGPAAMFILETGACQSWHACVQRIRARLGERCEKVFGRGELHAELLKALLVGLRSQFPQDLWKVMMRTGTAHIISISGLHMSVLSAFAYSCLLLFFRSQKKAAGGAAAALIFYMFIAGGSVPVQRAAFMGAAAYLGTLAEREVQPMRLLAWAGVLQLLQNPFSLESVSFQLSFLSVFILLLLRYLPPVHWILEPLRTTALVLAGTLPLAAWHFHMVSWTALIANLWAIPFFNFALVTGAAVMVFADVPCLGAWAAKLCAFCLDAGLSGLRVLAQWRSGWTLVSQPPIWKIVHYYGWALGWFLAAGVFSGKVKSLWKHFFFLGWLAAGCFFWVSTDAPSWSISVLGGTRLPTVYMECHKQRWLINAGQSSGGYDTHQRLLPYLKWRGIRRLDGIVLTDYPKDLELALGHIRDEVFLSRVYGPAPKSGQLSGLFSNQSRLSWHRAAFTPGISLGTLKIQTLSQQGKIKLIQVTSSEGAVLWLMTQLDAECLAVMERLRHSPAVIILYGAAGGDRGAVRRRRRYLEKRMSRAAWVYAEGNRPDELQAPKKTGKIRRYSLKELGALQIQQFKKSDKDGQLHDSNGNGIALQFLSGHRVTLL